MTSYSSTRTGSEHDEDGNRLLILENQNLNNRITELEQQVSTLIEKVTIIENFKNNVNDYIISQGETTCSCATGNGSSIVWYWRKYSNGVAECWGRTTSTRSSAGWGNIFYASGTDPAWNFPSNLFAASPVLTVYLQSGNQWAALGSLYDCTASVTPRLMPVCGVAYTDNVCTLHMHAIGRWK